MAEVSGTRFVPAPPEEIFDLLADARRHPEIDGSGLLRAATIDAPDRLSKGAKFGMQMKMAGVPYTMKNTVEEFDEPICIAWRHMGKHRWRYELKPVDGGTEVTETFDVSTAPAWRRPLLRIAGRKNKEAIEGTLDRLQARFSK